MDGHLEQRRRNLGLPNGKGEEQTVSEEEEEEVHVSNETSRENEVVEVYEPRIPYPHRLIEVTMEHEDSIPKDSMENYEEEMEEDNQGSSHLIEAESCIEEGFIEPSIQQALDETKKRVEVDPRMVDMFKKVEITIPLFDAIRQVPKYAKFLKDFYMNKDRIHELETISLGSSISALVGAIPEKCVDPGPCLVSCIIDGVQFIDCMCDLGAYVSIMSLFVYHILKFPPLKRSVARFVLADKSIITVTGIAEDVLVNIKGLVFPIDFHILEMPPSESERTSSILLGRPFMRTSRFKLDVYSGTYSFEIDGRVVSFNLEEVMKHPPENHSIFRCDLIDNIVAEVHYAKLDEKHVIEENGEDPSEEVQASSQ
ncbi:uncharacterized protein [Arachis hypogaea]|uniref:uncharacterized protein n=1 Tax=Arachis hypogaea TaxID=3818 RepID=UPI000DEC09B0|nr:uncharacterized protein LOC112748421 [Arachis hypogaea]